MSPIRLRDGVRKKSDIFFPDEIIINILSRLPAKTALQCRVVCRRWRDITSTLDFQQMHLRLRQSIPMILVSNPSRYSYDRELDHFLLDHFLLDKWWEPERKRLVYHRFVVESECSWGDRYKVMFSHGGLIVFRKGSWKDILIFNPASHEKLKITLSKDLYCSEIYGVFFHPLLGEYCTLLQLSNQWLGFDVYCKMLILGYKPCWRDISYPWSHRNKVQGPYRGRSPVLIGECLYWQVKSEHENAYSRVDIMKFDIRSEKFGLMHCPVPSNVNFSGSNINLLDIDGVLSFVVTSRTENSEQFNLRIWKLMDGAQQLWIFINHRIQVKGCPYYANPEIIAAVGEQLVLMFVWRLHVCNLKLGTTTPFVKKKYREDVHAFSHMMSLASLKNCKSRITMDKEGEVAELDMA